MYAILILTFATEIIDAKPITMEIRIQWLSNSTHMPNTDNLTRNRGNLKMHSLSHVTDSTNL